ncbi:MAG: hydroxymethylbilane synthase [Pseudomonadota bacterium]|nr:hydroxymethylbilane synthase [Pseudomonadota bacterium]MDE3038454.1 hydroxymethylbilane synthase [Pseudomonadota bacterium]
MKIGTRKSPLALAQAAEVRDRLLEAWPELVVELAPMATGGDNFAGALADAGGKGLFTKELEEALQDGRIDVAVHSVKDMQTVLPDGLIIGCILEREDPRDMLVGEGLRSLEDLPKGAKLGTSSLRRAAQVLMQRPDVRIVPLRGNVQTRLAKVQKGEIAATLLARAGLNRLDMHDVPGGLLSADEFIPAVGQGALGIECRENDAKTMELLAPLADADTERAVLCERAFLQALDGSCRTPIAGYATVEQGWLQFHGLIAKPDGSEFHTIETSGAAENAMRLGEQAGQELLQKAGADFARHCREHRQ